MTDEISDWPEAPQETRTRRRNAALQKAGLPFPDPPEIQDPPVVLEASRPRWRSKQVSVHLVSYDNLRLTGVRIVQHNY